MKHNRSPRGPEDLRKRAEENLKSEPDRPNDMRLEEANCLIHELRVHQIELEMQNEELRRVQNDLEISRARYADLYDFAPVGYLTLNKHGQILDLNLTAARQLGIERVHLVSKHFQYFVFQPDKKVFLSHLNAIFDRRERQITEVRLSPKGGEQFYARIESIYMEGKNGAGLCRTNISDVTLRKNAEQVLQNAHDELERCVEERTGQLTKANELLKLEIAEHERAEEALRESEELYRTLVSLSPDAILVADLNGLLIFTSPKARQIVGHSPEGEILGNSLLDWVAPEEQEKASANIRHLLAQRNLIDTEYTLIKKDGTRFIGEINAAVIDSSDGSPMRMIIITRDVTERKRADEERKKLREQLFQAQKMESVGRLAGGVAHDFNNMLGVIIGSAEMALNTGGLTNELQHNLQEIFKAGLRSADLTRQLLAFARKQTAAPKILDLNDTISSMLTMLRRLIGEDIELSWQAGLDLWKIKIDPSQVDQILANLAVNARDAISEVGAITIKTDNVVIDDSKRADTLEFIPGEYVLLTVTDTGAGMSKEVCENIFEPFFTTKELGKGTGLGLSTVYGIVKQNDGFIYVASEPGKGTTFKIYLPRFEVETAQVPSGQITLKRPTGTETTLLVEDDESFLKLGKMILEKLGYTVLAALNQVQAIHLVKDHPGDIHLLITDVVMPGMNGRELAEQLRVIRPNLKRLYMSGYTADLIAHHGILDEGVNFIQKPFGIDDLAAKVRQVLDHLE